VHGLRRVASTGEIRRGVRDGRQPEHAGAALPGSLGCPELHGASRLGERAVLLAEHEQRARAESAADLAEAARRQRTSCSGAASQLPK
jgi:hypothetical protein